MQWIMILTIWNTAQKHTQPVPAIDTNLHGQIETDYNLLSQVWRDGSYCNSKIQKYIDWIKILWPMIVTRSLVRPFNSDRAKLCAKSRICTHNLKIAITCYCCPCRQTSDGHFQCMPKQLCCIVLDKNHVFQWNKNKTVQALVFPPHFNASQPQFFSCLCTIFDHCCTAIVAFTTTKS